jgi:PAS domain S-box-containing protein
MDARATSLEEFLSAVLRGAAKILGCGSTNLLLINEQTQEVRIRLGTMAASNPVVDELEQVLGDSLQEIGFSLREVQDSAVYESWRDRTIRETSSLAELVGGAFPTEMIEQMTSLIGEHRFICVPALSAQRNFGVLLFQKEGRQPFSRQQRVVLLRYARRIAEILERDLMGQRQMLVSSLWGGPAHLVLDAAGRVVGHDPTARELLEQPQILAELRRRAAPPTSVPAEASALDAAWQIDVTPFVVEEQPCALCTVRHRGGRSEASLENQLLQLTLGDAGPALFLDTDFRITSCNAATAQLFGYAPAQLLHQAVGTLFAEPQSIVGVLAQQVLDPTNPYCAESTIILRRDGSVSPARVEALLLADDRQQAVGFLVLIRDGDADREAIDRLVRQERLATMGEMAAQLAHEMRNPLLAIGATLDTLVRDTAVPEQPRSLLALLSKEIGRLDMILREHLAPHDLTFDDVDLADVVEDVRRLLEGAYQRATIRSTVQAGVRVRADYESLKHVLFNLLLNALEASPSDGEVGCRVAVGTHDVSVFIEDRGSGLSGVAAECFRPFFTTKKNGTGLGLTVCQRIARAHGGLVDLRNREGGGCQAVVVLPRRLAVNAEG